MEARNMHYLSVVCNNDQLHVLGCLLSMPFMLEKEQSVKKVCQRYLAAVVGKQLAWLHTKT